MDRSTYPTQMQGHAQAQGAGQGAGDGAGKTTPNEPLPQPFAGWFSGRGWAPRVHQLALVEAARAGCSSLLIAPTGGGKTLAGFLPSLLELADIVRQSPGPDREHKLHTLYISPLKALAVDVLRNLETPCREMGLTDIRIETRTGDTPASKRQRQRAKPPDILLTTPEQLALFLAQDNGPAFFADLQAVIIDEAHAIAPQKRGDLLCLGLAALENYAPGYRRIGLSATVKEEQALARWLVPQKPGPGVAHIVRGQGGAQAQLDVLITEDRIPWAGHTGRHAFEAVYELIKTARTALVFVNTRSQAEMTFQGLWTVNEDALPIALHHGSLAAEQRRKVEAAMGAGSLRAVVCTSTLDLGIDWGDVDLVVQMGAPKGAARLIQRIGRANHRLDEASRAVLTPANRFEVLECLAAQGAVADHELDGEGFGEGTLDVLAQHIMGRACGDPFEETALYEEITSAAPYADLPWETFEEVLDFVATGGYSLRAYDRFKRIVKSPDGLWRPASRQAIQAHRMNVGAIVEDPMLDLRLASGRRHGDAPTFAYPVRSAGRGGARSRRAASGSVPAAGAPGPDSASHARMKQMRSGRKIGRIEEWYVNQLTPGDTFVFAGQILRFEGMVETDVLVTHAKASDPKVPMWQGGKFPLSTFLAARVRRMISEPQLWASMPAQVREWLEAQRAQSVIPDPADMLVETFPRGGRHYLVAYPFDGRLAHQTLGMLLTRRLERAGRKPLGFVANDYAISVWGLEPMGDVSMDELFHSDMLGDDLDAWIHESMLMKRTFRTCAIVSGMLERRMPGHEKTGRQVTFSTDLIYDVLRSHQPDHIIMQAAWNEASAGMLDVKRLGEGLARIEGKIRHVDLPKVSPLAVPVMLEIGKMPIFGDASEAILSDAADDLIAEAMG